MYLILNEEHSGTFANHKYEELNYQQSENVRPHFSLPVVKMRPPPFSPYNQVLPPPPGEDYIVLSL